MINIYPICSREWSFCNLEIEVVLIKFVSKELLNTENTINNDDNLLLDGMVDSLGFLRLVAFIEETYNLKISYEDMTIENFSSIEKIADYMQKRLVSDNGK